jgi:hypothetical protein
MEAAETASSKSSMVEATHAAHAVELTHVAAKASHPSLGSGNADRRHSEDGGR